MKILITCSLLFLYQTLAAQQILSKSSTTAPKFSGKSKNQTAVLGAFSEEVDVLKKAMKGRKEHVHGGVIFHTGTIRGRKVIVAESGIGKVNAAYTTTLLLEYFKPRELIFSGIAGSLNPAYQPGDLVLAIKTAYHDYGWMLKDGFDPRPTRNPFTHQPNPIYFPADSSLLLVAGLVLPKLKFETVNAREPHAYTGLIVTGDVFMASETGSQAIRKRMNADAIEMEGAAVSQICYERGVPILIVRCVSDNANHSAEVDFDAFAPVAARNSAQLVMAILERLK